MLYLLKMINANFVILKDFDFLAKIIYLLAIKGKLFQQQQVEPFDKKKPTIVHQ